MKICVLGLWHLGSVTAACLSKLNYDVVGLDFDHKRIKNLRKNIPPVLEPKIINLIKELPSKSGTK